MARASYRAAIRWMACNDDTDWAQHDPDSGPGATSVTAAMVADLFDKEDVVVREDLKRELRKAAVSRN